LHTASSLAKLFEVTLNSGYLTRGKPQCSAVVRAIETFKRDPHMHLILLW